MTRPGHIANTLSKEGIVATNDGPESGSTSLRSPEPVPVSALTGNDPGQGWLRWPDETDFAEVEVEMLQREGSVFRTNAEDFEDWWHKRNSEMCDDIIAFRIVGLPHLSENDAHAMAADWQLRHDFVPLEATYGRATQSTGETQ